MPDVAYIGLGAVLLTALSVWWEEAWRRHAERKARIEACSHGDFYFISLYDQLRPREWTRCCGWCGQRKLWEDDHPPKGAVVRTKHGDMFYG